MSEVTPRGGIDAPLTQCKHSSVMPTFDKEAARTMSTSEVRQKFPRFCGVCPDCGEQLILYVSFEHYMSGDW